MMKNLIKTTLILLALLMPLLANAHDFEVDGIYYYIINKNKAMVTCKGSDGSQYSNEYSGSVVIPETVSYNGTSYTVTFIGNDAFFGCSGLMSIDIPNSVTAIGSHAFSWCTGLTSIDIPNSVTAIGSNAFKGCTELTSIVLPDSIVSIGDAAFEGTAWYNDQPDGLVYAGSVAYKYKGTMPNGTSISLKQGTLGIAEHAFFGCTGLAGINIPNSVTVISQSAFYGCTGLTSIDIPNSVTAIDRIAFSGCTRLASIIFPNSVTSIGDGAFSNTAWYNDQPDGMVYAGSVAYKYKGTMPNGTSISLKQGTLGIAEYAFYGCTGLTSIDIPNSVTSISYFAFKRCTGLTSIVVASNNPYYDSRNNCNAIIETASNSLVIGCKNTTIPNSVTTISHYAFSGCTGLTRIDIPNSIISIGYYAFDGCTGLTNIDIPSSLSLIGMSAFSGCSGLTSINIPNSVTAIGEAAFSRCTRLASINIPNSVTTIGYGTFSGCIGLTSIGIPNSITTIGDAAFEGCSGLTSIDIGNSVTSIGSYAFSECTELTSIYCFAATPPECFDYYTFGTYSAMLRVPAASLAAYFTHPVWGQFENIVGDAVAPTGISISKDSMEVPLGEQFELTATVTPANASIKEVTWYSTDTTVAIVENGAMTPVGFGECDIVAMCFGMQAICHVAVTNRIMLDQHEVMLQPNHMLTLTPTVTVMPNRFTVTSSDPNVAAARVMNRKVQVVGVAEGTATITVAAADGTAIPATCLVTVYTEPGDVNMDGFTDIDDVTAMISYVLGDGVDVFKAGNANLNGDNAIDIDDITALISQILGN